MSRSAWMRARKVTFPDLAETRRNGGEPGGSKTRVHGAAVAEKQCLLLMYKCEVQPLFYFLPGSPRALLGFDDYFIF